MSYVLVVIISAYATMSTVTTEFNDSDECIVAGRRVLASLTDIDSREKPRFKATFSCSSKSAAVPAKPHSVYP